MMCSGSGTSVAFEYIVKCKSVASWDVACVALSSCCVLRSGLGSVRCWRYGKRFGLAVAAVVRRCGGARWGGVKYVRFHSWIHSFSCGPRLAQLT